MTSFKKYFFYRFKSTALRLAILMLIGIVSVAQINRYENYNYGELGAIAGWGCFIIPMLELYSFKNRRNMDTLFSLPLSRKKIALAHFLNGYVQLIIIFTVCTAIAIIPLLNENSEYSVGQLMLNYIATVPMALLTYGTYSFVFMKANSVVDGVIIQILSVYVLFFPYDAIMTAFSIDYPSFYDQFALYTPIDRITEEIFTAGGTEYSTLSLINCIVLAAVGIASIWGYFYSFEKMRTEKIGGISDSVIGYKLLIPLYAISLSLNSGFELLLMIITVVGYIIYRRSFRLKKSDYICIVCALALQLINEIPPV